MQFDELRDQTTLPADRLQAAFQREEVMAVLPVCEPGSDTPTVLVATPRKLSIASLRRLAGTRRWVVRWAPWGAVRMEAATDPGSSRGQRSRTLLIGGRRFRSVLRGRRGAAALRAFRRSLRDRRRASSGRSLPQTR